MLIRAIQGQSEARIQPNFSSSPRVRLFRKNSTISVTRSTRKPSKNKVSWQAASIKTKVDKLSISRRPLEQKPEQEGHGWQTFKSHHAAICVVDMEGAQKKNLKFYQTLNGCVVCFDTIPREHIKKVIYIRDRADTKTKIPSTTKVICGALTDRAHQPCLIAMEPNQHCEVHRAGYGTASSSSTTPWPSRPNRSWEGLWQNKRWRHRQIHAGKEEGINPQKRKESFSSSDTDRPQEKKRRLMQKSVSEYNKTPPSVLLVMVCSAVQEELGEPYHLDGEHPQ